LVFRLFVDGISKEGLVEPDYSERKTDINMKYIGIFPNPRGKKNYVNAMVIWRPEAVKH
jgi:hypothetical protein